MARSPALVGGALAVVLALGSARVRADVVADTVEMVPSGVPLPVLALDPKSDMPHLAYLFGAGLRHAWRTGGSWHFEEITNDGRGVDWAIGPGGRLAAAYVKSGEAVVVARPGPVGWVEDTVVVLPGWGISLSLAVGLDDEPVVAWVGS